MFRIESYITPILMNYVDRYVKNIRPQDAQLSLWSGEVALQNLDLRLDVLEEELQLPFEFLSGHIHELIIHVPWTKITSEPIQITINTIEFVLKLKDQNATTTTTTTATGATDTETTTTTERKKKLSKIDDNQQQQQAGYVPGLVNKIINNISINCHNIILKYVEEDIVVSMNVQLLSFSSADDNWQKSFIDINQTRIFLRKLVQISDLTICLDKRNAIGLIDVCQEPILYRCSLEMRMFKKYNITTLQKTSYMRIDIYSKKMEINISSLQFPMVMRLLILIKILKDGDLLIKKSDINIINDGNGGIDDIENINNDNESYLSWAWNLIPSVFPIDNEQCDIEDNNGHILNIGIYLGKLNITLKSSELFTDSIVQSTRKIRYDPILRICLEGIYNETNIIGKKWFNTTAGISKINLEPLGNYSQKSQQQSSSSSSSLLLFSNDANVNDNYLENSLFQNYGNPKSTITTKKPIIDLDDHLNQINEHYLLHRTPIFAFDMIHFIDIPDDNKSSDFGSDYEYSNLSEQSLIRIFLSSITIKYNSTLLDIIDAIEELINTYNYPPYIDDKYEMNTIKIPPPSVDDFDALMKDIPKKIIDLIMKNIKIEFYPIDDNNYHYKLLKRQQQQQQHQQQLNQHQQQYKKLKNLQQMPFINLNCERFHLNWTKPLYPNRLIYITSQLPEKPQQFMNSCYDLYKINTKNLYFNISSIQQQQQQQKEKLINFLYIPEINLTYKKLLNEKLWQKSDELIIQNIELTINNLQFEFTKFELIIIHNILMKMLLMKYDYYDLLEITNLNILNQMKNEKTQLKRIKLIISDLKLSFSYFSDIISFDGRIKSINGFIKDELFLRTINENQNKQNQQLSPLDLQEFCRCVIQWPIRDDKEIKKPLFIAILISEFEFIINKKLINLLEFDCDASFLSSEVVEEESTQTQPPTPTQLRQDPVETNLESSKKSTIIHDSRIKRQQSHPQESVHLSSEKDDSKTSLLHKNKKIETKPDSKMKISPKLKRLMVWIDIKQSNVIINNNDSINDENSEMSSTIIILPRIQCKCKELNDLKELNLNFPINKIFNEWKLSKKSTFPWFCTFNDLQIKTTTKLNIINNEKYLIHPINANITLALDDKKFGKSLAHETKKFHYQQQQQQQQQQQSRRDKEQEEYDKKHEDNNADENDEKSIQNPKVEEEILAFNLHIDTKPIFIELSDDQALIIRQSIEIFNNFIKLLNYHEQNIINLRYCFDDSIENDTTQISHEETTIKEIKNFLALNTNSEDTSTATITNYSFRQTQQAIIFLLMQWTVTKITLSLKGHYNTVSSLSENNTTKKQQQQQKYETKLNFDLEDFIVSIDFQLDYFKFKTKIGSLSMQLYEKLVQNSNNNNEWKANDYFKARIRTITEDNQHHLHHLHHHHHINPDTFFDLTLTIAETSDYFKRLGIKKNIKNLNKSIAEIDMHLKGIDILLDLNKLEKFIPIFCCITNILNIQPNKIKNNKKSSSSSSLKLSNCTIITDLPLLFAESQGITLYIPVQTGKSWCDVFIFKIGEMYITPSVKHPLARNPIRPDVYNKAAQLQILDVPGSKLEDRQYEFSLKNISAATGNWKDILNLMKENSVKLKNTNPAFEWNHQSRKTSLELNSIFNDFLITVTYAPCIIYKNVLICGTAIEINCVTDLVVTMNSHQLSMMNIILQSIQHINDVKNDSYEKYSIFQKKSNLNTDDDNTIKSTNKTNTLYSTDKKNNLDNNSPIKYSTINNIKNQKQNDSEKETIDSGIAGSSSRPITTTTTTTTTNRKISFNKKYKSSKDSIIYKNFHNTSTTSITTTTINENELYIPYKIELVAGLFFFKFLQNLRKTDKLIIKSETNKLIPINNDLIPLISFTIKTSMLIEYKNTEFIMKFFIYTINLGCGGDGGSGCSGISSINNDDNDNNKILNTIIETLTGNLNNTGIPPALLTFEYKIRNFSKKTEIDLQFGRPIKINLSYDTLKHLYNTFIILSESLKINDNYDIEKDRTSSSISLDIKQQQQHQQHQQSSRKITKIQIIRSLLYNAHKFSISTDKFFIEFHSSINNKTNLYDIRACFGDLNAIMTIYEHPEKLSLYISTDTLYIQSKHKMLLHPVRFKTKLIMQQENWYNNPLLCFNLKFDVIHFDIGPKNIQNLMNAIKDIHKILDEISNEFNDKNINKKNHNDNIKDDKLNRNLLKIIQLPEPQRKSTKSNKEEFYQDDLRAGAFQFIELFDSDDKDSSTASTTTQHSLPHPYQIQIILRNNGIVCWRYPQPRRICKLQIYPVPMETSQPITIKCRMEYYSEPHADFLYYCDFSITEMETKDVELPEEKITACIWRVIILQSMVTVNEKCFRESSLEDEESTDESDYISINDLLKNDNNSKSNYILQPKSLVACMRIDTAFSPIYTPKIKFFIEFSLIQINLQTQQQKYNNNTLKMPKPLKRFKLTQNYPYNHTFLTIFITNSKFYSKFINNNEFSISIDLTLSIKCLDYCCLSMFNFIEDTNIKCLLNIKKHLDINIVLDTIKLNCCTALIHTLLISHKLWQQYFYDNIYQNNTIQQQQQQHQQHQQQKQQQQNKQILIWSRYVICNRTQLMFRIGQSETNDMHNLAPGYCIFYSFRSCYQNKELIFQVLLNPLNSDNNNDNNIISCPISINDNGEKFIKLGNNVLIIKIFNLSETQKCILLKGQIQIISLTSNKFGIQFRSSGNYGTSSEILIDYNERITIFGKCIDDEELYFRLRFSESTDDEPNRWSGEIPLKSRKGLPWLVKIPIKNEPNFISFWIRVMREQVNFSTENSSENLSNAIKPIRIVIVIYPMFVIQSNFTLPLTATISSSLQNRITLKGKGEIDEIEAAATNETQHEVIFDDEFPKWHGEDRHNTVLTFNNIDWDKFFSSDNKKIEIKEFLDKISKPLNIKWPLDEINDINIIRDIQDNQLLPVPLFKCLPYRDLSYTLMMSISPWCLLINTLKFNIKIKNLTTNMIEHIDAGKIGMLYPIEDSFIIDLCNDNYNNDSTNTCTINKISIEDLQQSGYKELIIHKGTFISKILIEYNFNNGLRVIKLLSSFIIVNYSNYKMIVYPFCLKNGEKIDRQYLETTKRYRIDIQNESSKNASGKGTSLDKFHHFELNDNENLLNKLSYQFFVCLTLENDDLSIPIPLNESFNRKCFSLYLNGKSQPFAAVSIEKKLPLSGNLKSQYYLFIYNDTSPVLLIDNQTHFSYYVAETNTKLISSGTTTTTTPTATTSTATTDSLNNDNQIEIIPECNENYILWNHTLRPMCQTYYTPPSTYLTFPDTEKYHCDIILALKIENESENDSQRKIQWTAPIHTGYRSEKYFNVPLHGDVKIVVCDKHHTIKVFIFYVSQQTEFCIKDLRTRLLDPTKNTKCDNNEKICIDSLKKQKQQQNNNNINKIENNENITIPKRNECSHELSNFPIHINLFINEISINYWCESKSKPYLNREIFSIFIDDLSITYNSLFKTFELYANNLQIDNQLYKNDNYDFPVILCSEKSYKKLNILPKPELLKKSLKQFRDKPLILFHINFYDDEFIIETIHCQLNPLRLYIEDTFLNELKIVLLDGLSDNIIHIPIEKPKILCGPGEIVISKDILQHAMSLSEPLKLRYIRIDPINVILSFHTCAKLYVAFDHSPLTFSQYDRRNLLTTPMRFGQTIGTHYFSGLLFSCGWVVGSLEILGSPGGLARSFTTGIRDFVSMPIQGLFRGPWGFFVGISQGSVSLFRNITAGALNSVTKLASSVSRNLDRLTLDEEHLQRTEALRRSRPQGVTQGLSRGLTGLGINLLGAIGGLSRHTLEATSTVGVVTGLGKGLFGAIAKPISGAADLVALTGQGMLHSVGYNTLPEQRCYGLVRKIIAYPAECKISWQLIPSILSMDQILFYHEATLISNDELKRAHLILTTTVLTVFDIEKDQLIDILPIERVEMAFDNEDKTLINIKLLPEINQGNDDCAFTNERIIHFLKASNDSLPPVSRYSLEDLLQTNQKTRLQWSLYVSEHLGQHLFGYLKLIKSLTKCQPK